MKTSTNQSSVAMLSLVLSQAEDCSSVDRGFWRVQTLPSLNCICRARPLKGATKSYQFSEHSASAVFDGSPAMLFIMNYEDWGMKMSRPITWFIKSLTSA